MTTFLARLEHELCDKPALVDLILSRPDVFQPVPTEPAKIIRCRKENIERAIARGFARANWGESWRIEAIP